MHLLIPLLASVLFVFGMMFARQAIRRGASYWTGTFYGNLWLGLSWLALALFRWDWVPVDEWGRAGFIGLLFVLGQLLIYMAYHFGDVSVATPIFGVKILFVAMLSSLIAGQHVPLVVWIAVVMATLGVFLVQLGPNRELTHVKRGIGLTVMLALLASFVLSVCDVLLQEWGTPFGSLTFLPAVFVSSALVSLALIPWTDPLSQLRPVGALRPMLIGTMLMSVQAIGITFTLSQFGDATRVNIVYALRGLWAVALAWMLARTFEGEEQHAARSVMLRRVAGAVLITGAVITSLL